ncbi:LysR family transcriptional regulator [Enterobacter sp. UPMP2060]
MFDIKNNDLHLLVCVIRFGSFTKAAYEMGMSQAKLSKKIISLEHKIGGTIIERDKRPVALTKFGNEVFPYIENCIRENKQLIDFVEKTQKSITHNVNIYSPSGIQAILARYVLPSLKLSCNDINITMTTWNQEAADYFSGIEFEENCDILITYAPPRNENLISRFLRTVELNVYCTDSFYAKYPFTTIYELSQKPFILQKTRMTGQNENQFKLTNTKNKQTENIKVSGNFLFDNTLTAIEACRGGLGYLLTSGFLLDASDIIKPRLPSHFSVVMPCYIIYRKRVNQPYRIQFMVDYLLKNFTLPSSFL